MRSSSSSYNCHFDITMSCTDILHYIFFKAFMRFKRHRLDMQCRQMTSELLKSLKVINQYAFLVKTKKKFTGNVKF